MGRTDKRWIRDLEKEMNDLDHIRTRMIRMHERPEEIRKVSEAYLRTREKRDAALNSGHSRKTGLRSG